MYLPQELEVWYVIPAIRRELAKSMIAHGMSRKEISQKVRVTQSAICQYLKEKRGQELQFNKKMIARIEESARQIEKGKSVYQEIYTLCRTMRKEGILCDFHKCLEKNLDGCEICLQ